MEGNLAGVIPRYSEHILPIPELFANSRLCKWALVAQNCLKTLDLWIENPCDQIVWTLNDISRVFARPASSTEQCFTEADAIFRK